MSDNPTSMLSVNNEAMYRTIVEDQEEFISIASEQGVLSFVNGAYARHYGLTPEAMLGTSLFDYVVPEERPQVQAYWHALCTRRGIAKGENQMVSAAGVAYWVAWTNRVLTDEQGRVTHVQSVGRDITARQNAIKALRASESFLDRTGRLAGVGGWEVDLATNEVYWSDQTCRIHELEPGQRIDVAQGISFYAPEARPVITQAFAHAVATGQGWDLELPFITAKGRSIWVRAVGVAHFEAGKVVRLSGAFQDISERKAIEQQLAEQHELIRVTLDSIAEGVITTDAQGLVRWFNPVAERMTHWPNDEARGKPLAQVFSVIKGTTKHLVEQLVANCISQGSAGSLGDDTVLVGRNGTDFGIELSVAPIRDSNQVVLGAVLVFRDVSEQRRLSNEMSRRAKHDALTGLINRAEFDTRITHLLKKSHEDGSIHALLFIDLDRFKQVNDACGHPAGDVLLQQMAKLLKDAVRAGDTVARLGGDEFAILLADCAEERAQSVGGLICNRMDEFRFVHHGQSFRLGTSIGLVEIDRHWDDTAAIVHAADTACYAAKAAGRNRVHVWEDSHQVRQSRHGNGQWSTRLDAALRTDGFVLYAQRLASVGSQTQGQDPCQTPTPTPTPICCADDGLRCEVLLRLVDVDGTLILPGAFLPAAERFHMAARIDIWVVGQVLAWLSCQNPTSVSLVSINLSAQSVSDHVFHRDLSALIQASGADARKLCFEISESVALTNLADFTALAVLLRARGATVAVDDVGSAAPSLSYLKNLPIDWLKVDGKYLKGIETDVINRIAVRGFCEVASVLGLRTVAKGVASSASDTGLSGWPDLASLGLHCVQGYGVHRPQLLATCALGTGPDTSGIDLPI